MREFDALPLDLRRWLGQACLPWSPRSAARIWARAMERSGGDPTAALAALTRAEARTLARDSLRGGAVQDRARFAKGCPSG